MSLSKSRKKEKKKAGKLIIHYFWGQKAKISLKNSGSIPMTIDKPTTIGGSQSPNQKGENNKK